MKINSKKIPIFISIFSLIFFCYAFYFLYNEIKKNNIITKEINIEMQKQMNRFDELRSLDRGIKMVEKENLTTAVKGESQAVEKEDRLTIAVLSGDLERALAAFMLATTGASMGMKVSMFFTFWG